MTTLNPTLRRWLSKADPSAGAFELLGSAAGEALPSALARVAPQIQGSAFLIVRVDAADWDAIGEAIAVFLRSAGNTRLCLAGTRRTIETLTDQTPDQVGWMLDDVDVETPLAEVISERIEAIRFGAEFIDGAARNLRVGLALETMLVLSRDLGLCTLGSDAPTTVAGVAGRLEFDYVPLVAMQSRSAARARSRPRAAASGSHTLTSDR